MRHNDCMGENGSNGHAGSKPAKRDLSEVRNTNLAMIEETIEYLQKHLPPFCQEGATLGIVCGSGLSDLAASINKSVSIPYAEIPHFPQSSVEGHVSSLVAGKLNQVPTIALLGRFHYYEGYDLFMVTYPIRILARLGVRALLLTNSAGGLDENFKVGDLMVIEDHINFGALVGINPLRGENMASFGPRFPALGEAYLANSFDLVHRAVLQASIDPKRLHRGVYVALGGPSYETPAEVRFLRSIGGSAVGMSTANEVIVAAHSGIKNLIALSLISNIAISRHSSDDRPLSKPDHQEVLNATESRMGDLQKLLYYLAPLMVAL